MKFNQTYKINVLENDHKNRIKISTILCLMQDVANEHSKILKVDTESLNGNYAWILNRIYLTFGKIQNVNNIDMTTYAEPTKSVECMRNYLLKDGEEEVARAVAGWSIIDIDKRALVRPQELHNYNNASEDEKLFDKVKKARPLMQEYSECYTYTVKNTDLDILNHMNNTKYADVIVNALSIEDYNNDLESFNITFLHEMRLGQKMEIKKCKISNLLAFKGECNGEIAFVAEITFKPNL